MFISATRVVFIFPHGKDPRYRSAYFRIVNRIKVTLFINSMGQMTISSHDPTIFGGHVWEQGRKWNNEHIVIFVDVPNKSEIDIHQILVDLRIEINNELAGTRDAQPGQNVWIT